MPTPVLDGETVRVHFDRFSIEDYALFLKVKGLPEYDLTFDERDETYTVAAPARFAHLLGVDSDRRVAGDLPLADFLFDDQQAIVDMSLDAKRFACWSDCGLGKTAIQLEYARHVLHRTGGRVLLFTLNEIVDQTIEECRRFYSDDPASPLHLPLHRLASRDEMKAWCIAGDDDPRPRFAITNYEKMNPGTAGKKAEVVNELRYLTGIVLDESSRLKTGGGKQKWAIIHSTKGIPYKLSCTATPAPNDTMEFASQASFLEKMRSEGEIIWTYFTRDPKSHRWTVKRHAREAFFEFMAGWSIYVREPEKYGWRVGMAKVPPPIVKQHSIPATPEQLDFLAKWTADRSGQMAMFQADDTNAIQRGKLSQVAKGFRYAKSKAAADDEKGGTGRKVLRIPSHKPAFVANLIRDEVAAGLQVLVWTVFDAESDILHEELCRLAVPHDVLVGAVDRADRVPILDRFRKGKSPVLVSRAAMLGYGMNFQCCGSMVFSGWNDCYSEDTELLTKRGWLTFDKVTEFDDVATINQDSLAFEWQRPSAIIWKPYTGDLLHFNGERNFDLLVTPNHRLFAQRCPVRYRTNGKWELIEASQVADRFRRQEYRMLSAAASFAGSSPLAIAVPKLPRGNLGRGHKTVVANIPIRDFMMLAGWYLSEGYCRPMDSHERGRIVLCQTDKHPEYRQEIIDLARRLGFSPNTATKDITFYSIDLAAMLIESFGDSSRTMRIPRWVKDLDGPLLTILRDTMRKGDGNARDSAYTSYSKQLKDDFQELCIKTGIRGSVKGAYVATANDSIRPSIHVAPKVVPYSGMIGCVEVPNHTVVVRRNGIPVVSGNSYEAYYQAIRRAVRYGQTKRVRVHIPVVAELEGDMLENIFHKEAEHEAAIAEMEGNYVKATKKVTVIVP